MIRVFTLVFVIAWAISGHAAAKKRYPGGKQFMYRLTLTDKHDSPYRLDHPTRWLSQKSVERRRRQGLALDSTDLPVTPRYLKAIRAIKGISIVGQSRWNNTVVARTADSLAVEQLRLLPFVSKAELVWVSPDSVEKERPRWNVNDHYNPWDSVKSEYYGHGKEQIEYLNGQRLHNIRLRGRGMTIAIFDGGFQNVNRIPAFSNLRVEGTRDFVWHNPLMPHYATAEEEIYNGADHGTRVLSAMANGCLCISDMVPGLDKDLVNGENIVLYKKKSLLNVLEELSEQRDEKNRAIAMKGNALWKEKYTWEEHAKKLQEIIKSVN